MVLFSTLGATARRRVVLALVLASGPAWAWAQAALPAGAQEPSGEALQAEQAALERSHAQQRAQCSHDFFVNHCLSQADAAYRRQAARVRDAQIRLEVQQRAVLAQQELAQVAQRASTQAVAPDPAAVQSARQQRQLRQEQVQQEQQQAQQEHEQQEQAAPKGRALVPAIHAAPGARAAFQAKQEAYDRARQRAGQARAQHPPAPPLPVPPPTAILP